VTNGVREGEIIYVIVGDGAQIKQPPAIFQKVVPPINYFERNKNQRIIYKKNSTGNVCRVQ
jgi:hypothetical protein